MIDWTAILGMETEVLSLDAQHVGAVSGAWPEDYAGGGGLARSIGKEGSGYFRLSGFKGARGRDLYVPFTAIADFTDGRIRLKLTRKQLAGQQWDRRPAGLPAED
jgi:hypothetical protein